VPCTWVSTLGCVSRSALSYSYEAWVPMSKLTGDLLLHQRGLKTTVASGGKFSSIHKTQVPCTWVSCTWVSTHLGFHRLLFWSGDRFREWVGTRVFSLSARISTRLKIQRPQAALPDHFTTRLFTQ